MKIAILQILVEYLETEKVDKKIIRKIKNFDIIEGKKLDDRFKESRKEREESELLFKQQ